MTQVDGDVLFLNLWGEKHPQAMPKQVPFLFWQDKHSAVSIFLRLLSLVLGHRWKVGQALLIPSVLLICTTASPCLPSTHTHTPGRGSLEGDGGR